MSHHAQVVATRTGLLGRLQLATLENGVLPIPANLSIALEIGASDRDTLDVELLNTNQNWFGVTLEPLVDKYARGMSRSSDGRGDGFQRLGHHHKRGIIYHLAVCGC